MRRTTLLFALVAACSSEPLPLEHHEIGGFQYDMPPGWESKPRSEGGRHVVEWMPKENPQKESITLIQSESLPAMTKASPDLILGHLVDAQSGLGGVFSAPTLSTSKQGFQVARIKGSFTPANRTQPYRREHAVVIVDDRLVHILYTAERETSHRDVFAAVINSFHRKGA